MWQIEIVPADQETRAVALIVGAGRSGRDVNDACQSLLSFLDGLAAGRFRLWWAREAGKPRAAALLLTSPGRTGAILHSSTDLGLVPPDALIALLRTLAEQSLGPELLLVQSLLPPQSAGDIAAFDAAGFMRLAELIYMTLPLRRWRTPAPAALAEIEYRSYEPATHALFAQAIQASYEQSLDCPALEGLRDIEDVLVGHQAAGVFRPDLWTVALRQGQPVGVILLNGSAMSNTLEVVYMGVARAMRGHGLGRHLLARAVAAGGAEHFDSLTLAVDAANPYAYRLYTEEGFVETMRRLACMRTWKSGNG